MSEHPVHHVTLSLDRKFEFVARFEDLPGQPTVRLDEPAPLGESRGPNAAALVAAAAGNCLAASLLFCLQKSRASIGGMTARVAAHVGRNDDGRLRISHIDVDLEPELEGDDLAKLERCSALFEDFCVVTQSLRKGVPVNVTLTHRKEPAPAKG
jgi:organic hydroperoxide reductase OsmC/OhrA